MGHRGDHAICIKATSKVDIYLNNEERMAGCVFYRAGSLNCFPKDTAIQPDNLIPIPHGQLKVCHAKAELEILQRLPSDIEERLRSSIQASSTMSGVQKKIVRGLLDD
ncbi:MAG: hypothetical protein ACRD3T_08655 [Terriglobia bacterium]